MPRYNNTSTLPTTTRLESQAHVDLLVDELKQSAFCIIPSTALEMILHDNGEARRETHELNTKIAKSMEQVANSIDRLATCFETNTTQRSKADTELHQRLDTLIEKVSINNSLSSSPSEEFDVEAEFKKRKVTLEKIIRNEEMSKYYEALITEPQPFVRREFRTHVNKTTPERELVHRRQQAIDKVKTEINVMLDCAAEYKEKKALIEQKIEEHLTTHEDTRTEIEARMSTQDRTLRETFERNTMTKMKQNDDEEKMQTFEYLLKFTDNGSLNYRGNSLRTRHLKTPRDWGGRQRGY